MAALYYKFMIFWILLLPQNSPLAQRMCLEQNGFTMGNKTIEFSVRGYQNQTGHLITRYQLDAESPLPQNNWKMDLKHSINQYDGFHSFHIKGVLTVPPPKPQDYELFPGVGYYKFHHGSKVTFQEASSICTKEGGHLAIINSEEEANVIKTIYARNSKAGGPWSFIGFYDRNKNRDFVTIFGQPLQTSGFNKWHPSEPNNIGGAQFCGCVIQESGLLADVGCDDRLSFFCEYDLSWADQ